MGAQCAHPLEVHALHGPVHAFDHRRQVARHLSHRDRCLDPASDSVDATRKAEQVQGLVLLADRIRRIYPCAFVVALLERLEV